VKETPAERPAEKLQLPALLRSGPLQPERQADELRKLLIARYNAAVAEMQMRHKLFQTGNDKEFDPEALSRAANRILRAALELAKSPQEKVRAYELHLELARFAQDMEEARQRAGAGGSPIRVEVARYNRLDAEIKLLRARKEAGGAGKNDGSGKPARAKQTRNSLRVLGKAMHDYLAEHKDSFPLPVVPLKEQGKSLRLGLSWRVQLLPFLGEKKLYQQFKLDEPWDSPDNKKLIARMPKVFASPPVPGAEDRPGHTHYQVFTDAHFPVGFATSPIFPNVYLAALKQARPPRLLAIADGSRNTILIAEATRAVPWTKPEDLPYSGELPVPALGHAVPGVIFVCMADGEVRALSRRAPTKDLRALIDKANAVFVDPDDLAAEKFKGKGEKKAAKVVGTVMFKGEPLTAGWITFHSPDGREYSAVLQVDGTYHLAAVPVGRARVTVGTFPELPPLLPKERPKAVVLPRRYADPEQSGLTAELAEGQNDFNVILRP
jgi:hypothetical protein